ncbi:MAG: serine hydrolase [Streptosporangiales bacterium]|nr:serine hydrolase [Streptosporangiales bacterium]
MAPPFLRAVERAVDPHGRTGPPGASVALAIGDDERATVHSRGSRQVFTDAGELATPLPMTARTVHDMGSVTKVVVTTAALMTYVDAGELGLDDPVRRFLDPWPGAGHLPDVTVADLLHHRAGLWEWWPTYVTASDPDAAMGVVTGLPLRYPPHSGRHYSDLGFMALGRIAEKVGGMSLLYAGSMLVLGPFEMTSARLGGAPRGAEVAAGAPGDVVERHMIETGEPYPVTVSADAFDGWRDRVRRGEVDDGNAYHAFGGVAGHAGLFASATDLLQFGRALLGSLTEDVAWRGEIVRTFFAEGPDPGQALGFRVWTSTVDGRTTTAVGHTGFPGIGFAVFPEFDATLVLLTNRLHRQAPPPPPPFEPLWRETLTGAHAHLLERDS